MVSAQILACCQMSPTDHVMNNFLLISSDLSKEKYFQTCIYTLRNDRADSREDWAALTLSGAPDHRRCAQEMRISDTIKYQFPLWGNETLPLQSYIICCFYSLNKYFSFAAHSGWDTMPGAKIPEWRRQAAVVFTLVPKEQQPVGHGLGHPCSPRGGFLSQRVRCALSSSSDPSCIHPIVSGLGVRRKGGKGRGNGVCLQQIGFPCIFQQSKDKKHIHDPPLKNK